MPSLAAILTASEQKLGRALTRDALEKIVSSSPAITMVLCDAMKLEQSRGYADIEPELAWEQWQLIRETIQG